MTKKYRIENKISRINDYLQELSFFKKLSLQQIRDDSRIKASMERFLYLLCDSIISLLEMLIAFKSYPRASSYSENIYILRDKNEISDNQSDLLHKIVGLRNILSHDYERLDYAILKEIIDKELHEVKELLVYMENKV